MRDLPSGIYRRHDRSAVVARIQVEGKRIKLG